MFARTTSALVAAMILVPPWAATAAAAGPVKHDRVVSADPVDTTPHVLNGIVDAIALVGGTVVVGGSFDQVSDAAGTTTMERSNLFAYDLATGRVLPGFAPYLDGPVRALAAGADGTVYAGGEFTETGESGSETRGLVRLRLSDGSPVPGFDAQAYGGVVTALAQLGPFLYVGGDFTRIGDARRTALARLDAGSGAVDPGFAIEPGEPRGRRLRINAMALSGDRLAVGGDFTTLDGLSRPQLGLVDVGARPAKVASWRTSTYAAKCRDVFPSYVRGLDFAPDGTYLAVVTTGGPEGPGKPCDTAARFETRPRGSLAEVRPTWVNHTGGDSLYAVAATGAAVYVGGHQRWLDNPRGRDSAGPGAVPRPGIGAIDPRTGKALPWNPTRDRGIGVKAFLAHHGGLLVGSDTTRLGHEYHARVGMFPLP
ncbi:delta-60 repeat domain-containing protein [Streptosporangium sp. NPDC051023]|uniref:delta-60 repeat domain-containing protein n=1 Tax=Streptosporangium sp. NPDC051023 TaxID=3155410 RepID=UPI00344EE7D1